MEREKVREKQGAEDNWLFHRGTTKNQQSSTKKFNSPRDAPMIEPHVTQRITSGLLGTDLDTDR